jgi:hypothetical protein
MCLRDGADWQYRQLPCDRCGRRRSRLHTLPITFALSGTHSHSDANAQAAADLYADGLANGDADTLERSQA